jgi:formiminotetrahydrofolate cyclodeaminase
MNEMKDQPLEQFLDQLASKSATPGGGSAAAIMGAQGAALISMVCNLTLGKLSYAEVETDMQAMLATAEALRGQLTGMIKADIDAFNKLMAAYGLAKDSGEEKSARIEAIQLALKGATEVPLQCAGACRAVLELSRSAAEKGNLSAVSDAGAAAMAAYGGLKTAALNVYINTNSIKDPAFANAKTAELEAILANADRLAEDVYQLVKAKL